MRTRLDLLDSLPKGGICCELGVFRGDFSQEILQRVKPKQLYLVDLWEGQMCSGDRNGEGVHWIYLPTELLKLKARLQYSPEATIVQQDSVRFLRGLEEETLDWVYIDSSHNYDHTLEELSASLQCVKRGGFIMGHDYHPQFGVFAAVDRFVTHYGYELILLDGDKLPSFQILIPA